MEYHQPKTEPGLGSTDHKNLKDMSIHELVSLLRIAFLTEDFDRVDGVLVNRDKTLQTEILRFQEMVELEKLTRFQAEEDLRNRGKRAQNNYENLLKEVKKNANLADRDIIGELREKNNELELEVCELKKLKKKWVRDGNALAQLRIKVGVLENENNVLRVENSEMEKSMKKNNEALADPGITDSEDRDEENVGDNDTMEPNPLERNERPSKRSKNAQGASSAAYPTPTPGPINPWGQIPPSISWWSIPTPGPTNPWGQIPPSISGWPNPTLGATNPWGHIPPSISRGSNPTLGPTNPWGQIPPSISGWPNPTPGPTNPWGQIPPFISGWSIPTLGTTNPWGQILPSISRGSNPTPGPTNPWGQIPPSNSRCPK